MKNKYFIKLLIFLGNRYKYDKLDRLRLSWTHQPYIDRFCVCKFSCVVLCTLLTLSINVICIIPISSTLIIWLWSMIIWQFHYQGKCVGLETFNKFKVLLARMTSNCLFCNFLFCFWFKCFSLIPNSSTENRMLLQTQPLVLLQKLSASQMKMMRKKKQGRRPLLRLRVSALKREKSLFENSLVNSLYKGMNMMVLIHSTGNHQWFLWWKILINSHTIFLRMFTGSWI